MQNGKRAPLVHTRTPKFSLSESSEDPSEFSTSTQYTTYTDLEEDTDGENRDTLGMLPPQKMTRSQSMFSAQTFMSCSNQAKCEDVIRSYTKLKIYFTVLCVVNIIIILLVCVFFAVFFIRLSKNEQNIFSDDVFSDQPRTGKLESASLGPSRTLPPASRSDSVPCALLRLKLNLTSIDSEKVTCGLEDIIDAIMQFAKPREYNDVLHLVKGVPLETHEDHPVMMEHDLINWKLDNHRSSKQGIKFNNATIIIPTDGFYFVYSRVAFSVPSRDLFRKNSRLNSVDIQHSLRKRRLNHEFEIVQDASINCANHSFVHSSYLQRALYLRGGDELKVTISNAGIRQYQPSYGNENCFGIFRL